MPTLGVALVQLELGAPLRSLSLACDVHRREDLDAAVGEELRSIRLGWGQVYDRPCSTAEKVGLMLGNLGWPGKPTKCPKCSDNA